MDNKNEQQIKFNISLNNETPKNPKIKTAYTWPVIIVVIIIFWPVGLYLLWKRISLDKKASLKSGKSVFISGVVCLAIALMGLLVSVSEGFGSDDINAITFFTIAGVALILFGNGMTKNARKYKKYLSIIINQKMTSIDNIAAANAVTYDAAIKDIQKMIDKGYFTGAYINEGTRELILPQTSYTENIVQNSNEQHLQTVVVVCKSCGANNTVIAGRTTECEFCGSPIN